MENFTDEQLEKELNKDIKEMMEEDKKLQDECRKILNFRSDIKGTYFSFEGYREKEWDNDRIYGYIANFSEDFPVDAYIVIGDKLILLSKDKVPFCEI